MAAVYALPEPYRSAVVLTKVEGLDTAEAARALGVPRGTVKWRVSRGLGLLRQRCEALHGEEGEGIRDARSGHQAERC